MTESTSLMADRHSRLILKVDKTGESVCGMLVCVGGYGTASLKPQCVC